ncbi:hypothetical protein FAM09_17265 [Niastella caeni]|uniref:Lipoprotein n=1 Tax=Niastella caeni TaxID=2569763 RepID=A0A4S8HUU4_9BACT|nr:hypothetical protein [Niastella caeni]THU38419.1 hypothetical protein FAM09_17265 [Niastella caeni]
MKITWFLFVAISLVAGCRENCKEKIASLYKANRKALATEREVNKFTLQLSYVPAEVLTREDPNDTIPAQKDTAYYYFKLQVSCPEEPMQGTGNKTALFYGLDSLFATAETPPFAIPELIEPVITGSQKRFEYLLVFAKKDFTNGALLKIIFFDRLFTNTKQVFVFDRKKIDEIETLQCK